MASMCVLVAVSLVAEEGGGGGPGSVSEYLQGSAAWEAAWGAEWAADGTPVKEASAASRNIITQATIARQRAAPSAPELKSSGKLLPELFLPLFPFYLLRPLNLLTTEATLVLVIIAFVLARAI